MRATKLYLLRLPSARDLTMTGWHLTTRIPNAVKRNTGLNIGKDVPVKNSMRAWWVFERNPQNTIATFHPRIQLFYKSPLIIALHFFNEHVTNHRRSASVHTTLAVNWSHWFLSEPSDTSHHATLEAPQRDCPHDQTHRGGSRLSRRFPPRRQRGAKRWSRGFLVRIVRSIKVVHLGWTRWVKLC